MSAERSIIMLIDDDETSLAMGRKILEKKYTLYPVSSGEKALIILKKVTPDLILLDIEMPDMDGYTVIKQLKQEKETRDIPVIFLTSQNDPGNELDGLVMGAIDYVTKPFSPIRLIQRLDNHLLAISQKKELIDYNKNLQNLLDKQTSVIKNIQSALQQTISEITEEHISRKLVQLEATVNALLEQQDSSKSGL